MADPTQTTPFRSRLWAFRMNRVGYAARVGYNWWIGPTRWFGKRIGRKIYHQ